MLFFKNKKIINNKLAVLLAIFSILLSVHSIAQDNVVQDAVAQEDAPLTLDKVPEDLEILTQIGANPAIMALPSWHFTRNNFESEVAGFRLVRGDVISSAIGLADLDVALSPEGERYIPVVRLFALFEEVVLDGQLFKNKSIFAFQVEFGVYTVIDLQNKLISIDGEIQELKYLAGISEISENRDIYLPPDLIKKIFNITLEWDDQLYEYEANTKNLLKIWKGKKRIWSGADAELVTDSLPELFASATSKRDTLDFVQTRTSITADARENSDTIISFNTSQDLWGGLWGGRYKARFSQPNVRWIEGDGFDSGDQNLTVPRRLTWTKQNDRTEVVVGDSSFALSELALPFIDFAGVRYNGIVGRDTNELDELKGFGLTNSFLSTRRFEGIAELDSVVTLFINDNPIATVDVDEEPDSPVGFGRYVFDEISIPAGNVVSIRIEIQEPGGRLIVEDKSTTSSVKLRPAGQLSFAGGVGTNRDTTQWDSDGVIAGVRALYGVNSAITIGATLGLQDDSFGLGGDSVNIQTGRVLAEKSQHGGVELTVSPFGGLIVTAEFASSDGENKIFGVDSSRYQGDAFKVNADVFPFKDVSLRFRSYRYDRGYFNGADADLEDRKGSDVLFEWRETFFNFKTAYGQIEDNLDRSQLFTNEADFLSIQASSSSILPNTYIKWGFDRISPEFFEEKSSKKIEISTELLTIGITADLTDGDLFDLATSVRDLFQNLNLPLISVNRSPSSSIAFSRAFANHRFVLDFDGVEDDLDQQVQLTHYWDSPNRDGRSFLGAQSLRIITEFGHDRLRDSDFASNRINFYLDNRRRNRIGMETLWDETGGWTWSLDVNLSNIFAFGSGEAVDVSHRAANLGAGGVDGKVFLDRNANGVRDPGEKGISNVLVKSTETPYGLLTDGNGEFLLQRRPNQLESEIYIDINTVPATLIPIHAKQKAVLKRGRYSRVEFALAPMVSLSGLLMASPPDAEKPLPIKGAVISLKNKEGKLIGESVTASDGSYYFNAVPGEYGLWVDPSTVDLRYVFNEPAFELKAVGSEEYQELEFEPIYAGYLNEDNTVIKYVVPGSKALNDEENTLQGDSSTTDLTPEQASEPQQEDRMEEVDSPIDLTRPKVRVDIDKQDVLTDFPVVPTPSTVVIDVDAGDKQPEGSQINNTVESPIDLTRPKIKLKKKLDTLKDFPAKPIRQPLVMATGLLFGENIEGGGYVPVANAGIALTALNGDVIATTVTADDGAYTFKVKEGLYFITLDPKTMPARLLFQEPALSLEVVPESDQGEIIIPPIYITHIDAGE